MAIRLHRAVSWFACAELQEADSDMAFVSLWISFNACYGAELGEQVYYSLNEKERFRRFIDLLVRNDQHQFIYNCLWESFSGPVRLLIDNHYIYAQNWGRISYPDIE